MSGLVENRQRDELFNSDLIYKISKLAGFEITLDEVTEERIRMRMQSLPEKIGGLRCEMLSDFKFELFEFIIGISKSAGETFKSLKEISKYPDLVKEELKQIETGQNESQDNIALGKKQIEEDLFNSDLIYEISRLAGFEIIQDEVIDERIKMRMQLLPVKKYGLRCEMLSSFARELFEFVMEISDKVGVEFERLEDIAKYPELVKDALKQYEVQDTKQQDDKQKSLGTYPNNSEN